VVDAAGLSPDDAILEIGPGLGGLTRYLAQAGRQVVAVELDERLLPPLQEVLRPFQNVRVVHGDILDLDPAELMAPVLSEVDGERPPGYVVAANIPYYITSPLIRHLLEGTLPPQRLTLTVQVEVAERICAGPGEMSLLAIGVQVYGRPQVAARIPAGAFYPVPQVDSAVVRVELYPQPLFPAARIRRGVPPGQGRLQPEAQDAAQRPGGWVGNPRRAGRGAAALGRHRPDPPGRDPQPGRMGEIGWANLP
jgi:16S rRNA (adenine1518-N6/adenine1519-N6)-dimethyltransferase